MLTGRGVRSTAPIEKGTFLCTYEGLLLNPQELKEREVKLDKEDKDDTSFLVCVQTQGDSWGVDATEEDGSLGRLLNHSRLNPNCKLQVKWLINPEKFPNQPEPLPHLYLITIKDIAKGEELRWDYGETRGSKLKSHPWLKF